MTITTETPIEAPRTASPADVTPDSPAAALVGMFQEVTGELEPLFEAMEWAEEEIEAARQRHQETARGPIWHSFSLMTPTLDRLKNERLYRIHVRELLERVDTGRDTRPATDAEMMIGLLESSLQAPLTSAATCLYLRIFARALPAEFHKTAGTALELASYESVHGPQADEHEGWLRRQLTQAWRAPEV
ncbi:hypothetical protein ACGF12_30455 [Kitasatospora sp. NPDC048296]|uniref:hypothetical protein n=1 Tax=Kitasatospora sp. NPDC048296 TaxID=3364048 RepID=UPI003722B76B